MQKILKTGKNDDNDDCSQECFRVFSKDEDGCIPADEIKWAGYYKMTNHQYLLHWWNIPQVVKLLVINDKIVNHKWKMTTYYGKDRRSYDGI